MPAGPVNSACQALKHPQARAVGMVIDVPDGQGGIGRGIGTPIRLVGKAEAVTTPAPQVGEQNRAVLRELGCGDSEINALIEARAVRQV